MTKHVLSCLRRNSMSATGLSLVEGEIIDDPAQLPEHLVEVHVFDDANKAQAFVEGLCYASANGVAWTWEPGREIGNRCVLTARFAEDRPAGATLSEAVPVIKHARNDWDARDRAESDKERWANDERRREADRRLMQPLRAAMAANGLGIVEGAQTWIRCSGTGATIQRTTDGSYEIDCKARLNRRDGDEPLMERYVAHAANQGVVFDPTQLELRCARAATPDEAALAARLIGCILTSFDAIAEAFWHEQFMETMSVTPRIRTFLSAVAWGEAVIDIVRRNPQIRAGGVLMKRSEIGRLVSAGWLGTNDAYFPTEVWTTQIGIEAIGAQTAPEEAEPPAPSR